MSQKYVVNDEDKDGKGKMKRRQEVSAITQCYEGRLKGNSVTGCEMMQLMENYIRNQVKKK